MKAKININGFLEIERAGRFKLQRCPFRSTLNFINCGDGCPLFEEPFIFKDRVKEKDMVQLKFCQSAIFLDKKDFVDEREDKKPWS